MAEKDHPPLAPSPAGISKPGVIAPFAPASEPYPLPEDPPDAQPWEKADFKRKALEAGFPCDVNDGAFLSALYHFGHPKDKSEDKTHESAHKSEDKGHKK